MNPTPTPQSHDDMAAAAYNSIVPVLPGNADTRKREADQAVPYVPSPADGSLARMPTAVNITIDYAQFEWHVRKLKKFLSDHAFSCPVCKNVFAGNTPKNAMKHLLRHLDDHSLYPYTCAHDGCDYTAITDGEVQHHVSSEHQAVWTEDVICFHKRQCTHAENKARLDALCDEMKAMLRSGLMLPSENILDVLHCLDFDPLLALQRSGSTFYDVAHRNLAILPRLRVFDFYLDLALGEHSLREILEDARDVVLNHPSDPEDQVPYTDEYDYSMLHQSADMVGTNFINSAIIASSLGEMRAMKFDMRKAVEALPALKHVRELIFECRSLMHTSYAFDMETLESLILSPLDNLQFLELGEMNNRTDWTFLRKDWALRLRSLSVEAFGFFHESGEYGLPEIDASGQTEILEYCTDFAHLKKGKSKKVKITGWLFSSGFLQRIITTVSECKDWLTVVVDGASGFFGNDADYTRSDVPPEHPEHSWSRGFVRYSARVGSHRVFVQTSEWKPEISLIVTNNPFVTTWYDAYGFDVEDF